MCLLLVLLCFHVLSRSFTGFQLFFIGFCGVFMCFPGFSEDGLIGLFLNIQNLSKTGVPDSMLFW